MLNLIGRFLVTNCLKKARKLFKKGKSCTKSEKLLEGLKVAPNQKSCSKNAEQLMYSSTIDEDCKMKNGWAEFLYFRTVAPGSEPSFSDRWSRLTKILGTRLGSNGKAENCGFIASWPFLTYLFNCTLHLYTKTINTLRLLWRKIVQKVRALSNLSLYRRHVWLLQSLRARCMYVCTACLYFVCMYGMFVFCNPCARVEWHEQERAQKLFVATLNIT